ncbi:hypothetical protein PVL29_022983 [Vitis rotundifolia]|uniref:Uncharacterized protein n=1 Tax=Vitis rotundifolia TaxID=103349 RepID=A0AA38YWZ4_VITRO|nr:hypothetical protein PVL29_022965 [Vitis rotundifolia]KAJ9678231.1 hypothetical protein PVL29_022966 [Vitis rotundifolia]KAJ9678233.1 hypothetical protein PVL29_022968 [Vitis rotundifolia]KAJ9678235.1 hypothetical protein PVL29_022970 [Vitis rotundifolia]KAJ9678239.1 hypothetical protein PVL29_022974 [Vitis rotundifolia]
MAGSDHPFDGRMGRLGRKGVLGHNLGLGARKRLASASIVLKWGELSRGRKRGRSATIDFDGRYLTIGGSDRRSAGPDGNGKGGTYWHDKCGRKYRNSARKREKGCNTRTSQEVTHPSTTLAQARLTAEF